MEKFVHKKSLGQNFLKDKKVLINIIDIFKVTSDDLVIEIGPGQGALTKYLKLYDSKLICYEIDKRVEKYLTKFEDDKTKIIFKDFMEADILDDIRNIEYDKLYIIANLPYYITSPIIEKIISLNLDVSGMAFMVQNEVADRYSAKCGTKDYGYMTALLSYYYDVTKSFVVSRKCFDPVPNVDSAVIKFVKKDKKYSVKNEKELFRLIKDAFRMKRKNIKNNLGNYNLEKVAFVLNKYDLTLQDRAESIPIECFVEMANILF